MWHDRDPYREHSYVPDTFWLVVAAVLFAACGLVWLIGQVAAILFGAHEHLPVRLVDMLGVLLRLPGTWDDPAKAWPPSSQPLLPGPVGMYAAAILTFWIPAFAYGLLVRLVSPRARRRRKQRGAKWASLVAAAPAAGAGAAAGADHPGPPRPHQRPPPRPPLPGRRAMPLGPGLRPTGVVQDPRAGHPGHPGMAGQPGHHLHQTRRPAGHLRPPGQPGGRLGLRPPRPRRRPRGPVDPARLLPQPTPTPAGSAACWPTPPTSGPRAEDANYWQLLGAKLLSVLLFAAAGTGRIMADVARWVDVQDVDDVAQRADGDRQPAGPGCLGGLHQPPRQHHGLGLRHRRDPPRRLRRPDHRRLGRGLRPGPGRAADRGQQHPLPLRPRQRAGAAPAPVRAPGLAWSSTRPSSWPPPSPTGCWTPGCSCAWTRPGNCAAIKKLPQLATTGRGQGIQLLTIWHDEAQLQHRYGHRASTVLNGHRAKLLLSGPGRPGLPRARQQAGRRRGRHPDLGDDRRGRPGVADRVDGVPAVVAAGGAAAAQAAAGAAGVWASAAGPDPAAALVPLPPPGLPGHGRGRRRAAPGHAVDDLAPVELLRPTDEGEAAA